MPIHDSAIVNDLRLAQTGFHSDPPAAVNAQTQTCEQQCDVRNRIIWLQSADVREINKPPLFSSTPVEDSRGYDRVTESLV